MTISTNAYQLLLAYDQLTNFAGGPDLPWVIETYEQLDDSTLRQMLRAFSYAWAAGQLAAGYYHGDVEYLAQALFAALPTWDDALSHEDKKIWLQQLGVDALQPEPEPRPLVLNCFFATNCDDRGCCDRAAIEDMATYFRIGIPETTLLYRLGQVLSQTIPAPVPAELEVSG